MLTHTVTSPRTNVTAHISAETADVYNGTWSGAVAYDNGTTVRFIATRSTTTITSASRMLVLNHGALDDRDLTTEELIRARQIVDYMWAQIAQRAQAERVAGLLSKAAEFALDGEVEKAARLRAAALA